MSLDPFTTREVALGIWIAALLGWAATSPKVRSSFWSVVRTALSPKLLVPFLGAAAYTAAVTLLLRRIGLWTPDLLKDTLLWFLFAGVALAFSGLASDREFSWKSVVSDQLKVIILVEWIVNTYTFSLATELLLIPLLSFVAIADAVWRSRGELAPLAKVTGCLQGLFGLGVLGYAIRQAFLQSWEFDAGGALRSLALAPILSVCILPFGYAFGLASAYEELFLRFRFGQKRDQKVIRYAKWRLFRTLGLRLHEVRRFTRQYAPELVRLGSQADADALIAKYERRDGAA